MILLGHIWNLSLISLILFRREKISFSLEIISSSEAKKIIAFCPRLFKTMVLCSSVKEGIRIPGIQDQGLKFGVQTFIHMPLQTTQKKGNKSLNFFIHSSQPNQGLTLTVQFQELASRRGSISRRIDCFASRFLNFLFFLFCFTHMRVSQACVSLWSPWNLT